MEKKVSEKDYLVHYLKDLKLQLEWMRLDSQFSREDLKEMEERIKNIEM